MEIRALTPCGAEITQFSPRDTSEAELLRFDEAFRTYSLIVIRGLTGLSTDEQVRLMARLGPVAVENFGGGLASFVAHDPAASNSTGFTKGELQFHSDVAFAEKWLIWMISLHGEEVTEQGGETRFAHTGKAYRRLDPGTKAAIAGKRALYLFDPYGRSDERPAEETVGKFAERGIREIVYPHPYGDGEVLTVNFGMTDRVVGLPRQESTALLQRLFDVMYAPGAVYTHKWAIGDLLIWDNRVVQHARNDFDPTKRRILRRVSVGDESSLQYLFRRWAEQIPAE